MERYAELAVKVGINVEKGQKVIVNGLVEHAPFVRAIVKAAYEAGAGYVESQYADQHVKRALIENVDEDMLTYTPPWILTRYTDLEAEKGATIHVMGDPEPNLFSDLDPERVGRARMLELSDLSNRQTNDRSVAWVIVAYPNEGWATEVFGEPDVDRLWDAVAKATRLYEDDPVEAWWAHVEELGRRTDVLNEERFDALRYVGPGTDLIVGLSPRSRWTSARFETSWGRRHVPNIPTEEVFTSPDFRRTEGVITSTKPLHLPSEGVTVTDLVVTFEGGKIVNVEATAGAEVVRNQLKVDDRAPYLGEVALVDRASAVGETGVVFANTLFDENATSHIAYGSGFTFCFDDSEGESEDDLLSEGLNTSRVHTDFMVGGPEVTISGVRSDGTEVTIISDDTWRL